jgi:hypothetical protein
VHKALAALAALALMSTAAYSEVTVDRLITVCSEGASEIELASCGSYVRGVADAAIILQENFSEKEKSCIPPAATGSDLAKRAFPYVLKQHSGGQAVLASVSLMAAFHEAYPCVRK